MQGVYAVGNFQPSEDRSRSRPSPPTLREPPLSSLPNVSQSTISNSHQGKKKKNLPAWCLIEFKAKITLTYQMLFIPTEIMFHFYFIILISFAQSQTLLWT